MSRNTFPAQNADERKETLEQIALRIAPEYSDKDGRIVLIVAYTRRLVAELDKQAEPVAWRKDGHIFTIYPEFMKADTEPLYLRPASTAEIEARALEEAASWFDRVGYQLSIGGNLRKQAAAKREGK
ncbi:MAG TPA: hypothetical protein DCS05_05465 [Nitrospiraceae bacterium]|nr:hypothetical protein [Nitrospiraceae bacterium]